MLVVFNDRLLSATQYQEQYHDLWKLILVWLWARTKMCSPLRKGSRKEKVADTRGTHGIKLCTSLGSVQHSWLPITKTLRTLERKVVSLSRCSARYLLAEPAQEVRSCFSGIRYSNASYWTHRSRCARFRRLLDKLFLTSLGFLKSEFHFIINFEELWKVFTIDIAIFLLIFITVICLRINWSDCPL